MSLAPANGSQHEPIRIAIVGGGIGGLCLTLGLLRYAPHIHVDVYEAAQKFSEIGAGVAIGHNAEQALFLLDPRVQGVYNKIRTSNVKSNIDIARNKGTYLRIQLGIDLKDGSAKAGQQICEIQSPGGFGSVHRARFLDGLESLLPADFRRDNVHFDHRLIGLDEDNANQGVVLKFANGKLATADAVIGCDGIKSNLRRLLLGEDAARPQFTSKYAYRGLVPMSKAVSALGDDMARNGNHHVGYDGHVLTFPIDKGETMNVVAFRTKKDGQWTDYEWVVPMKRQDMEKDFEGWGDHVQTILKMMEKCNMWALFDHPPAKTYHSKIMCLMGDAAHASTPHHGSGAGMAIEDAYILAGILGSIKGAYQLQAAFAAFEEMRKERTERLPVSSRQQAAIYDFQDPSVGDDLEKIANVLPSRWNWIWDHDIVQELGQAKMVLQQKIGKLRVMPQA